MRVQCTTQKALVWGQPTPARHLLPRPHPAAHPQTNPPSLLFASARAPAPGGAAAQQAAGAHRPCRCRAPAPGRSARTTPPNCVVLDQPIYKNVRFLASTLQAVPSQHRPSDSKWRYGSSRGPVSRRSGENNAAALTSRGVRAEGAFVASVYQVNVRQAIRRQSGCTVLWVSSWHVGRVAY